MTRIILVLNVENQAIYIEDDPRPPRELMISINRGETLVGAERLQMAGRQQRAQIFPHMDLVLVVLEPPPVRLTRRQYQVLFGLSDGKPAAEIASDLGISRRMIYGYTSELKERFGLQTVKEILVRASDYGLIDRLYKDKKKKNKPIKLVISPV